MARAADAADESGNELPHSKALGPMALVTEPAVIEGVKSWTVATISPRGRIYQAEFSPDGTRAATLGIDATLRLWNPATGKLVRALVSSNAGQHAFAWSRDGKQIAVAENSRVLVWETGTGKRLKTFDIERATQVFNAAFSPDGGTLAVAMLRGIGERPDTVELYALESGEMLDSHRTFCGWSPWMAHWTTLTALLCWSPDGERLAIGNDIWDTTASASRDAGAGVATAWRDDGVLIKAVPIGQGDQAAIELWRVDTNERLHTLCGVNEAIRFRAFSPGGRYILVTVPRKNDENEEGQAYVWDTSTGELAGSFDLAPDGEWLTQYALSPDGKHLLAFGPSFGNVWSVAAPDDEPPGPSRKPGDGPPGPPSDARDGLERLSTATPLWKLHTLLGDPNLFTSAWSPDGACLALRGEGDVLSVWELAGGRPRFTRYAQGYADWRNDDGSIRAWWRDFCAVYDPVSGQPRAFSQFDDWRGWPCVSPDGGRVAAVGEKELTIYATDTGEALRTLPAESKYAPTWSLDPNRLITIGDKTTLWDLETGEAIKTMDASAPADASPDGKRIALVYDDGKRLELRDVASGEPVVELENDPSLVVPRLRLAWSRDGTRLAGFGRIWDAQTGKTLCLLPRFPPSWLARFKLSWEEDRMFDNRAAWSPDGAYLAYLAADRSVPVVEAATGRVVTTLLHFTHDRTMSVSPHGHFHCSPRFESELVYVVETDAGQEILSPQEFAERYGWRNDSGLVGIDFSSDKGILLPQDDRKLHAPRGEDHHAERGDFGGQTQGDPASNPKSKIENPKSLGPLALVQRPAALAGVESWSLEAVLQAGALYGHDQAVALSPDGKLLAVGGQDGHVRIYEPFSGNTPRLTKILIGHGSRVVAVDFSPDGKWIASAESARPNVRLWDAATGKLVSSTFIGLSDNGFTRLAWSPDGATLAIGAGGGVLLVDPSSGEIIRSLSTGLRAAWSLSWSPDSGKLAVANWGRVVVFDVDTGEVVREFLHPEDCGREGTVAWSADGESLAFSSSRKDMIIWKVADGMVRATLPVKAAEHQRSALRWLDEGDRLGLNTDISESDGGSCKWEEWEVRKGERMATTSSIARLAHSADGHVIAAASHHGGAIWGMDVIDTRTKKRRTLGFRRASDCVAWSADGRALAESGGGQPNIWRRDPLSRVESLPQAAANGTVLLRWLGDSGSLLDARQWSDAALWSEGKQGWQPKMLGIAIDSTIAVSPDGKRLAFIAHGTDWKTVTIYDLAAGTKLREIGPHAAEVRSIAWSPDAARLATGTDTGDVTIWDTQTAAGLRSGKPFTGDVTHISWSPNGETIAARYGEGKICVCDGELNVVRELRGHDRLAALNWSNDGKELLTVDNYQIRRWDVASGKTLSNVTHYVPTESYSQFEFSPDLKRIAAPGSTCRVLSAASGELQASIVPLTAGQSAVISPDGHYLATPGAEKQLVYVIQTADGQELLSPKEFADKYGWKNDPAR
ncbi:MAG TPA: WD40 repeat domain-containing protein [Pirellulales bacterium]|nr:WD40 repeat domain-containing protein [Pirellulales bacterium]